MNFIKKIWRETLLCALLGGVIYLMYYWTVARPEDRFVQSYMLIAIVGGIVGIVLLIKSLWRDKWKKKATEGMQKFFSRFQKFFEKFADKLGFKRTKKRVLSGKTTVIFNKSDTGDRDSSKQAAKPPKWKQLQTDRARMRYLYRQMISGKIKRGERIHAFETPSEISSETQKSPAEEELFNMYIGNRYDERKHPSDEEIQRLKKELEIK